MAQKSTLGLVVPTVISALFLANPSFALNEVGSGAAVAVETQVLEPALLPIAAESVPASSTMSFKIESSGDCHSCTWLSAQGDIVPDTPGNFANMIAENPELLDLDRIHLDSDGGDFEAAMRLGHLFRSFGFSTAVAGPATADGAAPASCVGACVLAFAGGVERFASRLTDPRAIGNQVPGILAIHEFLWLVDSGDGTRVADTLPMAQLFDYFSAMGISAELLQMASLVPSTTSLPLSESRLSRFAFDTAMVRQVDVLGYANGVAIAEAAYARSSGSILAEMFCKSGELSILFTIEHSLPFDPDEIDGLGLFSGISMRGMPSKLISSDTEIGNGSVTTKVTVSFPPEAFEAMQSNPQFTFTDTTGPEANKMAEDLSFALDPSRAHIFHILEAACQNG